MPLGHSSEVYPGAQRNTSIFQDQAYSNTWVPVQVNMSQHESTRVGHESTPINTSPERVNTSQLDQKIITVYRSLVVEVW